MDNTILNIGIILAFVVVIILALGLGSFAKGGAVAKNHSNRLMRYRLIAQAAAVLVIFLAVFFRGGAN
ncbi:MAG: twin transmembrane helix small protein [Cypionkella sp.]|nr:twin transmembrane helix small protein [Cypionkella sp.]